MERELIICKCENIEHQIVFSYFSDDDGAKEIYMTIHLSPEYNIFKRIWKAIKYIFGYRSMYGHFDEVVIDQKDSYKLVQLLQYLDPESVKKD